MATVRDIMGLDSMKSLRLLAGEGGLDRAVSKISILDYEFTRAGVAYDSGWANEFVLSSFLYAVDNPNLILSGVKRLHRMKAVGLAIRNVYRFEIDQEVIRFANQNNFPLFVMDDCQLFFEDVILEFNRLEERANHSEYQERKLEEILYGRLDTNKIKENALDINFAFGKNYYVCYMKPENDVGKASLNHLLLHGMQKTLEQKGDALIRYGEGAFLIHSVDQSKAIGNMFEYWHQALSLEPSRYSTGISDMHHFLHNMRIALLQSYYACYYAQLYGKEQARFNDIGVYQFLFRSINDPWQEAYLESIMGPISEYDYKNKGELWETLLLYEFYNGNIKEVAKEMYSHDNTIRYRIKKIYELFNKEPNDMRFEIELLIAVKLYKIQSLIKSDSKLFD